VARALEAARGTLVVTPESVVPLPLAMLSPEYGQRLVQAVAAPGRAALVGIFLGDEQQGYVNSMIGLQAGDDPAGGRFYRYGKRHLLPFGEFIPPGFHWFVRALAIPLDDQARGDSQAPFVVAGQRLRPLICYEDLFGEDFVASVVGPDAATVLVNASNLAWFGTVMVQDQHLQFSRMRALEFQRPVVRSTNTGATAVVDHHGVVTARLPPAVAATLEAQVEGRQGDTPYARWLAGAGLAPLWVLVLAGVAGLGWRRR
jgi:apolipoprotein N-acyltransferase